MPVPELYELLTPTSRPSAQRRGTSAVRARAQRSGHRAYIDAANLLAGLALEVDARELIRDYRLPRIEHAVVRTRADVVATLKQTARAGFSETTGSPSRSRR